MVPKYRKPKVNMLVALLILEQQYLRMRAAKMMNLSMEEIVKKAKKGRNVAGVIPLAGWNNSFDFPWPDYLQPIRQGMLAVERSVYECAYAIVIVFDRLRWMWHLL